MSYPRGHQRASESVLAEYLSSARQELAATGDPDGGDGARLSAEFEALRWFELPAACLR
jgi:hypothetical protein